LNPRHHVYQSPAGRFKLQYDLIIEVLVDSNTGLIKFISKQLSGIGGITKTETFVTLKSFNKWV